MSASSALEGIPGQLWRMVALAAHRLLMLDYDGTLAPFRVERDRALPLAESMERVLQIAGSSHTGVAIVSGRPVAEIRQLIGSVPAILVGEHGWEQRMPDGTTLRRPLLAEVAAGLGEAERLARDAGWDDYLERKRSAVVLHTRGLAEAKARELEARCNSEWSRIAVRGQLIVDRIDGGVEIRARGRNKGTVVLALMSQSAPGTLGVFVGDDVTDEDAFDAVRDWGFGIRVGPCTTSSLAMGHLPTCEAVPTFLERWIAVAQGSPAANGGPR